MSHWRCSANRAKRADESVWFQTEFALFFLQRVLLGKYLINYCLLFLRLYETLEPCYLKCRINFHWEYFYRNMRLRLVGTQFQVFLIVSHMMRGSYIKLTKIPTQYTQHNIVSNIGIYSIKLLTQNIDRLYNIS